MNHQEASDRLLQQVDSWDAFRRSVNSLEGKKAKGDAFERLIQIFLGLHPEYQWQTQDIWLYDEIPGALKKEPLEKKRHIPSRIG